MDQLKFYTVVDKYERPVFMTWPDDELKVTKWENMLLFKSKKEAQIEATQMTKGTGRQIYVATIIIKISRTRKT